MFEIDKSDSNPFPYATKETSFVYQDKRGFFMLSGAKLPSIQENTAETGVETVATAVPAPVFAFKAAKMQNTFGCSLLSKEVGKLTDDGICIRIRRKQIFA